METDLQDMEAEYIPLMHLLKNAVLAKEGKGSPDKEKDEL